MELAVSSCFLLADGGLEPALAVIELLVVATFDFSSYPKLVLRLLL